MNPGENTMNHNEETLARRRWLMLAGAATVTSLVPTLGWTDDDDDDEGGNNGASAITPAVTGLTAQVVVVGGGMAGVTAAKYLRLWGGSDLRITLVEPETTYVSNIMSNLVLNGGRSLSSLGYTHANLTAKYGVQMVRASVASVDKAAREVTLSNGAKLPYDRLVLAPGVEFEDAYGLTQADYDTRTPHAWRAGPQTQLLRDQLVAMSAGGTFVMTIPKSPYRCPPGPYERACLVADFLKTHKSTSARVVVLDENLSIQAEVETFTKAFTQIHAGVITYIPGVTGIQIDATSKLVTYVDGVGNTQRVQAQVVNPIAPHRATGSGASGWLTQAGLANGVGGRWAAVNVLSYESTASGGSGVHVIGDAAQCGLPKAGHVANQEAKICADAIVRQLGGQQPDPAPVANSACFSPITASTASWLTAVYQYDSASGSMKVANNGGNTVGAKAVESASISSKNFKQMNTWFTTLMGDSFS
jgi:sulfide dehydrogenase [flavocytochrome c] flavoprotein chain